jgi:hypothetical protein
MTSSDRYFIMAGAGFVALLVHSIAQWVMP